jgi:peroxiredoxin
MRKRLATDAYRVTFLGGLFLLLTGCVVEPQGRGEIGSVAPDYSAVMLAGDPFDLADYRGEVVLLNIWATWCPPCRQEMPHLQILHEAFAEDGLRVVGVSIDASGADRMVQQFLDELGVDFMVARDPADQVSGTFGAYGVPLTVLIDRQGVVQWRHLGPVTSTDERLRSAIQSAL